MARKIQITAAIDYTERLMPQFPETDWPDGSWYCEASIKLVQVVSIPLVKD